MLENMLCRKLVFAYIIVYILALFLTSVSSDQTAGLEDRMTDSGETDSSNSDNYIPTLRVNKIYFKEMETVTATCSCKSIQNCSLVWRFEPDNAMFNNLKPSRKVISPTEIEEEIQFKAKEPLTIVCWTLNREASSDQSIYVSDLDAPVAIRRHPDQEQLYVGEPFELTCEAISENYSKIEWYKYESNGTNYLLKPDPTLSRIQIYNFTRGFNIGQTIKFTNTIQTDSGYYICKAFHCGHIDPDSFDETAIDIHIQNHQNPDNTSLVRLVKTNSEEVKLPEGVDWEMKCQFGYTLKWFKNDEKLKLEDDDRLSIVNNGTTLVIKSLTMQDRGIYTCVGDNELGSYEKISTVIVENKETTAYITISLYVIVTIVIVALVASATIYLLKRKTNYLPYAQHTLRNNEFDDIELHRLNPRPKPSNLRPDIIPTTINIPPQNIGSNQSTTPLIDKPSGTSFVRLASQPDDNTVELRSHDEDEFDVIINRTLKSVHQENVIEPAAIAQFSAYVRRSALIQKKRSQSFRRMREENDLFATLCQDYHFPEDRLEFTQELGSGVFGSVKHAFAYDLVPDEEKTSVAIKSFRFDNKYAKNALLTEIRVLTHVGEHKNVVNLMGIITKSAKGEFMLMMEYCSLGNIRDFLRENTHKFINEINPETESIESTSAHITMRTQVPFTTTHLVSWSYQVVRGMVFLSSKGIIHGDLAARNILLCDDNFVKICDFGLSKIKQDSNYYRRRTGIIPIKWIAPETYRDNEFSTYTDIWSFGVVLWELFSLGREPYSEVNDNLIHLKLQEGYRMGKPNYATEDLYTLMRRCWSSALKARPSFLELEREIGQMLDRRIRLFIMTFDGPYILMNLESDKIREEIDLDFDSDILNRIYENVEISENKIHSN